MVDSTLMDPKHVFSYEINKQLQQIWILWIGKIFGVYNLFLTFGRFLDSLSTEVLAFTGSNFGEAVQSQLGMPEFFCSAKFGGNRVVIREKAGL